jgi:hypothetical protein
MREFLLYFLTHENEFLSIVSPDTPTDRAVDNAFRLGRQIIVALYSLPFSIVNDVFETAQKMKCLEGWTEETAAAMEEAHALWRAHNTHESIRNTIIVPIKEE